jgi:hypothetical protein
VSTDVPEEHIASIFRVEKISSARNQSGSILLATCFHAGFLLTLILLSSRWRRNVPPKRRLTLNGLYGIISQKIVFFRKHY